MRPVHVTLIGLALAIPLPCLAQSGAVTAEAAGAASGDAPTAPKKKKGGLLGKVKGLAGDKVVKEVAKTAACTMLPGGQLIAGAIDAADSKDAAGTAAGTAAGALSGQSGCMPGAGLLGNPTGGAQQAAAAKAAAGAEAGAGVALPGMPTVSGQGLSAGQMKQMQEHYRKMGMDEAQLQAMQEMMASMAPGNEVDEGAEAEPAEVSTLATPLLTREKNKLVLRGIPWMPGYGAIRPGSEGDFAQAITALAAEIQGGSKHYKVEVKVEDQGDKGKSQVLAQQRATVVVGALVKQGVPERRLGLAGGSPDKDPRVILSEGKPEK